MKIYCLSPEENWICDRIAAEWYENCSQISTKIIQDADIIWLLAGWCWNQVHPQILINKKVVVTVHHIVPDKLTPQKRQEFLIRDQFVDCYHVPNEKTFNIVSKLTKKPIRVIGYWFDNKKWFKEDKEACRKNLGLPENDFIIGSFQRDTEGGDLKTPKLEKGPDLLCDYISKISDKNIHILLGGWRRQYVISRLEDLKIDYTYFELADLDKLRQMYCALDLYIISSRHEGGPQSVLEASGMRIPAISTNVGMVPKILHKDCIFSDLENNFYPSISNIEHAYEQAIKFEIRLHKQNYIKMFNDIK